MQTLTWRANVAWTPHASARQTCHHMNNTMLLFLARVWHIRTRNKHAEWAGGACGWFQRARYSVARGSQESRAWKIDTSPRLGSVGG